MFEAVELGHKIDKATYKRKLPKLRRALLDAQTELREHGGFPVVILISGVDGAGKGETVNLLNEWMDPRHIRTRAFGEPTTEEQQRPPMYRFWRALPPKGTIGILFGSWYTQPIVDRVMRRIDTAALDQSIAEINRFEKMLVDEGALVLKFWFHLSKQKQQKRLRELEKDPETRWRVTKADWKNFANYDRFRRWSEHTLRETSTGHAPWTIIEGADPEYRSLTAGETLLAALRRRLDGSKLKQASVEITPIVPPIDGVRVLDRLDLSRKVEKSAYTRRLEHAQGQLNELFRSKPLRERTVIAVFEGNDAAGKGGAIRRVTQALDARWYDTVSVAAPTEEERAQPYLWRFYRQLPGRGRMTIFDRSWYGRVLVERVEGFCSEVDWMRAYSEINDFEEQLARSGAIVAKFWLAISKQEQEKRFKLRQKVSYKRFKITAEDWRNRRKWNAYAEAVDDMVERTSTEHAPWTLVEANDKYHARLKVLETLIAAIENRS
ncbi:MAG TPA: polyphosphate:AMP phosphotransferase [Polyangiales bacterium]